MSRPICRVGMASILHVFQGCRPEARGLRRGSILPGPPGDQLAGIGDGGIHVAVIGNSLAGDVEGGAVVDRGAVDRQSDGHVDRRIEGDELDRDMALVVMTGLSVPQGRGAPSTSMSTT